MEDPKQAVTDMSFPETLLLSGGGYRAAWFHLGVLKYLSEFGPDPDHSYLESVKNVVAVSGGCLTGAHFAANKEDYCKDFQATAKQLASFLDEERIRDKALSAGSHEDLFNRLDLHWNKIKGVELYLLGTSVTQGDILCFSGKNVFGYDGKDLSKTEMPVNIQNAIKASIAYPPLMPSLYLTDKTVDNKDEFGRWIYRYDKVIDGGVIDNTGVLFAKAKELLNKNALISDAGKVFVRGQLFGESLPEDMNRLIEVLAEWPARLIRSFASECVCVSLMNVNSLEIDPKEGSNELSRRNALHTREIATDLVPLDKTLAFAIARVGYELAKKEIEKQCDTDGRKFARASVAINRDPKAYTHTFWNDVFEIGMPIDNGALGLDKKIGEQEKPEDGLAPRLAILRRIPGRYKLLALGSQVVVLLVGIAIGVILWDRLVIRPILESDRNGQSISYHQLPPQQDVFEIAFRADYEGQSSTSLPVSMKDPATGKVIEGEAQGFIDVFRIDKGVKKVEQYDRLGRADLEVAMEGVEAAENGSLYCYVEKDEVPLTPLRTHIGGSIKFKFKLPRDLPGDVVCFGIDDSYRGRNFQEKTCTLYPPLSALCHPEYRCVRNIIVSWDRGSGDVYYTINFVDGHHEKERKRLVERKRIVNGMEQVVTEEVMDTDTRPYGGFRFKPVVFFRADNGVLAK